MEEVPEALFGLEDLGSFDTRYLCQYQQRRLFDHMLWLSNLLDLENMARPFLVAYSLGKAK